MAIEQDTAFKRDLNTSFPWCPVILFKQNQKPIETQQLGSAVSTSLSTESTVWLIASTVPHVLPRLSRYTSGNKHQMATSQALASLAQDLES